jgi:hypothetical protein
MVVSRTSFLRRFGEKLHELQRRIPHPHVHEGVRAARHVPQLGVGVRARWQAFGRMLRGPTQPQPLPQPLARVRVHHALPAAHSAGAGAKHGQSGAMHDANLRLASQRSIVALDGI